MMPALTGICSATRHMTAGITADCIRRSSPPHIARKCLWNLKKTGYQVGTGFMVGSPYQTPENLADDMMFLSRLNPQMVGIGPFVPHMTPRLPMRPAELQS